MPYFVVTLGGTNGKITVIREMEVESKLRIKKTQFTSLLCSI